MSTTQRTVAIPRRHAPSARDAERYRALARDARRRRARARRTAFSIAAWPLILVLGLVVIARTGDAFGASVSSLAQDIEYAVGNAFPSLNLSIRDQTETTTTVSADPIVDQLPQYTSLPSALLQGHVPSFALTSDRRVELTVNGALLGTLTVDAAGHFAQQLTLREGANDVVIALVEGTRAVASTGAQVVYDKTPPALSLVRPAAGATVDGTNVTVEGKTDPGTKVTINDRTITAAPDGTFSDTFTAPAGSLPITVVARDLAGNEAKQQLSVTVKPQSTVATTAVSLTLDKSKVRPGEPVVARAIVVEGTLPKEGVIVSFQIGVFDLGTARTDRGGVATLGFAAPTTEGDIGLVAIAQGQAARTTLTVAK